MKLWKEYFELLIKLEGEDYENDPDDPRGETKFGIDKKSHPNIDIKNLTIEEAENIYLKEFEESFSSKLPEPLSYVIFDFRVTSGESSAVKAIQRPLLLKPDGIVGPITMDAIAWALEGGQDSLTYSFTAERIVFYERLAARRKKSQKYLKGWINRAVTMDIWADEKRKVIS